MRRCCESRRSATGSLLCIAGWAIASLSGCVTTQPAPLSCPPFPDPPVLLRQPKAPPRYVERLQQLTSPTSAQTPPATPTPQ